MKRSLVDPADIAQKHRKIGLCRISLHQLGFLEENRGGLGISPYHNHEVAWDCVANGVKLNRYGHVDVVRLPANKLEAFRETNRNRCASEALMPTFSEEMVYGCLTKTHFVHSQKLANHEGKRTLFDEGKVAIAFAEHDEEARAIRESGVLCAIYDEKLLDDPDALNAIMGEDNLNESVQMREDARLPTRGARHRAALPRGEWW